ncbi:MAG: hypothetical protein V4792_01285 [Pseudomonadota bacterium]
MKTVLASLLLGTSLVSGAQSLHPDVAGAARLVKGAPYCADAVHETVQPLLDADGAPGNRIVRQNKTRACRDGEGRTRQEVERNGRKLVYLRDPVTREAWVLDTERKTARGVSAVGEHAVWSFNEMADGAAWRDYAERMREWARGLAERARSVAGRGASAPTAPPAPPSTTAPGVAAPRDAEIAAIVREAHREAEAAQHDAHVRVLRLPGAAPGVPPAPAVPVPPGVSWTANAFAPRGAGVLSSLGSKEIEGLKANGERTSWTIEAGKVGNDKPIIVLRDVWTSPELMLTVQSRDFDPRRGETNYRLVNVRRGEPDPALMKVPDDYAKSASGLGRG